VVNRAIDLHRLTHVPALFEEEEPAETAVDRIVGRFPALREVYKAIGRLAAQDVNVLICGGSGSSGFAGAGQGQFLGSLATGGCCSRRSPRRFLGLQAH
jgi:hypothetical protein